MHFFSLDFLKMSKNPLLDDEDISEEEYIDPRQRMVMQSMEKAKSAQIEPDYDFDDFLESKSIKMKEEEKIFKQKKEQERGQSKYIESLLKTADERKFVNNQVRGTKILKEIEKEKEIYGDTEVIYTNSYGEKVKQDAERQKEFDQNDTRTNRESKNIGLFKMNMLTRKEPIEIIHPSHVIPKQSDHVEIKSVVQQPVIQTYTLETETPKPVLYPKPSEEYLALAKKRALDRMELRLK